MYTLSISIDGKTEEAKIILGEVPTVGKEKTIEINGRPTRIKFSNLQQLGNAAFSTTALIVP